MKKVVSLSLFGEESRYAAFVPAVVRAFFVIFPKGEGWSLRLHHDDCLYWSNLGAELHEMQVSGIVDLRYMGRKPQLCWGMLWRLAPVFDEDVDVVFCRDLDALPMPRDRE